MRARARARLSALLLLGLALAGCGGSAYTKSDFVAGADAICAAALRETRAVPTGTGLAAYAAGVLRAVQSEAAQLHGLRRPPGGPSDRALLARYFAALDATVRDYRALVSAARDGDAESVASVEAALSASPLEALAGAYGMRACGAPSATVA